MSWVAMDRIYEREVLPEAKLRKQAGERPLRSRARRLTDGELLAKLRAFGVEMDRPTMDRLCRDALSAEEITRPFLDKLAVRPKHKEVESDWVWICLDALWQRWFPDRPSFEALDDKMQIGYDLLASSGAVAACRVWLEVWQVVLHILDQTGIGSIGGFDERFRGTQSLFNWIQDLESELWNAGLDDRQFLSARIALCEEATRRFPSDDGLIIENRRRALAESYFELGDTEKAESLYRKWLADDPRWGWGWIGWADCYWFTRTERRDLNRSEQILRDGFAVDGVRDHADIAERIADLCQEQGRTEEEAEFRRQAKRSAAVEATPNLSSSGRVLRQKTPMEFSRAEVTLDEPSNVVAMPRPGAPPAHRRKIGRNEPCPCGSGKKFKRCCGA